MFASHSHGDHYSPVIFGWRGALPRVRYVLSDDIRTREEAFRIGPGETLDLGDLSVRALRSTDAGAALPRQDGRKDDFSRGRPQLVALERRDGFLQRADGARLPA